MDHTLQTALLILPRWRSTWREVPCEIRDCPSWSRWWYIVFIHYHFTRIRRVFLDVLLVLWWRHIRLQWQNWAKFLLWSRVAELERHVWFTRFDKSLWWCTHSFLSSRTACVGNCIDSAQRLEATTSKEEKTTCWQDHSRWQPRNILPQGENLMWWTWLIMPMMIFDVHKPHFISMKLTWGIVWMMQTMLKLALAIHNCCQKVPMTDLNSYCLNFKKFKHLCSDVTFGGTSHSDVAYLIFNNSWTVIRAIDWLRHR